MTTDRKQAAPGTFTGTFTPPIYDQLIQSKARIVELEELVSRLRLEAQLQAGEAKAQRATVREAYQICTGASGEPGDWNGALPIRALAAERDALQAQLAERDKPCVWTQTKCHWTASCGRMFYGSNAEPFCGCGHPVEVKEAPHD